MRPPVRDAAAVVGGVVLGVVAVVVARAAGADLPWLVAVPAGLAFGVLAAIGLHLPHHDPGTLQPEFEDRTGTVIALADLSALHFAVRAAATDPDRFEQRIRPRLYEVAVDLLWQRHGVDFRTPEGHEAARDLSGPLTWALLTAPPDILELTPRSLSDWLDEMEKL
jgi:anti-sigma factor RsiW